MLGDCTYRVSEQLDAQVRLGRGLAEDVRLFGFRCGDPAYFVFADFHVLKVKRITGIGGRTRDLSRVKRAS